MLIYKQNTFSARLPRAWMRTSCGATRKPARVALGLCLFVVVGLALYGGGVYAAELQVGAPEPVEDYYAVPISLASEAGESVASLQFDVGVDETRFEVLDVQSGVAAAAATKGVNYTQKRDAARIIVAGLNRQRIKDGEIAVLFLRPRDAQALDEQALRVREAVLSDPDGKAVPLTAGEKTQPAGEEVEEDEPLELTGDDVADTETPVVVEQARETGSSTEPKQARRTVSEQDDDAFAERLLDLVLPAPPPSAGYAKPRTNAGDSSKTEAQGERVIVARAPVQSTHQASRTIRQGSAEPVSPSPRAHPRRVPTPPAASDRAAQRRARTYTDTSAPVDRGGAGDGVSAGVRRSARTNGRLETALLRDAEGNDTRTAIHRAEGALSLAAHGDATPRGLINVGIFLVILVTVPVLLGPVRRWFFQRVRG